MKYLKTFESLSNEILTDDYQEIEDYLIDFIQMGLEVDVKLGSAVVVNFDKLNDDISSGRRSKQRYFIQSHEIDSFSSHKVTSNSLTVDLKYTDDKMKVDLNDLEDYYQTITYFLKSKYKLIPNCIFVQYGTDYRYFESVEKMKEWIEYLRKDTPNEGDYNISFNKMSLMYYRP